MSMVWPKLIVIMAVRTETATSWLTADGADGPPLGEDARSGRRVGRRVRATRRYAGNARSPAGSWKIADGPAAAGEPSGRVERDYTQRHGPPVTPRQTRGHR